VTTYREVANGAQVKVHAIQLVLAALLASGHASGRVLVLDELGTCQDSVLEAAAEFCGEVLWYTHLYDAEPYNQPTRVWAFDPNGGDTGSPHASRCPRRRVRPRSRRCRRPTLRGTGGTQARAPTKIVA
jgi:hypothetical protein